MRTVTALALAFASFAPACFPPPAYRCLQHEVHVRSSPGGEEVDLVLFERGIHAGSDEARDALARAAAGRRMLPPHGGWMSFDFDEEEAELEKGIAGIPSSVIDSDESARTDPTHLELLRSAQVASSGLHLDEHGRLSLFQVWRFTKPALLLDWMNRKVNEDLVQKASSDGPPRLEFPLFDEASWERAVASARRGDPWIRIEDERLALHLPITREGAAKCLAATIEDENVRMMWGFLLSGADRIVIEDEGTTLWLGTKPHGWIQVLKFEESGEYDPSLTEAVKKSERLQPNAPTLEELARTLDARHGSRPERR